MNTRIAASALAVLGGAMAMCVPWAAHAGNVGYYKGCSLSGDASSVITAAGHTPVVINALDATSLAGLSAVVVTDCPQQMGSSVFDITHPALNAAVANGMGLVVERGTSLGGNNTMLASTNLPGSPTFSGTATYAYPEADDLEIPAGAPIINGPGGALTPTSLDRIGGSASLYNITYWYPASALPTGAIPFITTSNSDHVGAFGYLSGAGRVAYTDGQFSYFLAGGIAANNSESFGPGGLVYLTNVIAWTAGTNASEPEATCASEGYTGTKLKWCQNICESEMSPAQIETWIHRWIGRYRTLPYCAVEDEEEPELPPQE